MLRTTSSIGRGFANPDQEVCICICQALRPISPVNRSLRRIGVVTTVVRNRRGEQEREGQDALA